MKEAVWRGLRRTHAGYRLWLCHRYGLPLRPTGRPQRRPSTAVLLERSEVEAAIREVSQLGLPPLGLPEKFWDALIALQGILDHTLVEDEILDAGAEIYSPVLPWLARYGYRRLVGCNLIFGAPEVQGPIRYERADITKTAYGNEQFAAVTCMSVVEHGVDLPQFFREMRRVLKPGGILVVSTDYWCETLDTRGRLLFGAPWRVFTGGEMAGMSEEAQRAGFEELSTFDPRCQDRVIQFDGLEYTFAVLTFRRATPEDPHLRPVRRGPTLAPGLRTP